LKPLRSVNPSQTTYQGLIEYKDTNATGESTIRTLQYSPLSLHDRRDYIQIGDKVTFQIESQVGSSLQRAVNVEVNREMVKATVDSVKGDFGFINYEVSGSEGNGKLFFHMSEVRENAQQITQGSTVEFSVVYNQRSGKFSAARIRPAEPVAKEQRPQRLRMRSVCDNPTGPQVTVIRQPRGPADNNTAGFKFSREKTTSPKATSPRQNSPRQASPRQASPRQASPRQASPRQASPRQASPKSKSPPRN
jgi:cold shock CspA family protein